jgi:hypothetical protein
VALRETNFEDEKLTELAQDLPQNPYTKTDYSFRDWHCADGHETFV